MAEFQRVLGGAQSFAHRLLTTLYEQHPWPSPDVLGTLPMDHLCLRVSTIHEYSAWKAFFSTTINASLLTESLIAGRPIATYKLQEKDAVVIPDPHWKGEQRFGETPGTRKVTVIELPSPKEGSDYETGWEHAEFALRGFDADKALEMSPEVAAKHAMDCLNAFSVNDTNKEVVYGKKSFNKGGFNIDLRWDPPAKDEGWSVKFHWLPLEQVIAHEIKWEI
ncbi:UNVERIFIED_CONTAM: hypothetical protein HDU68_011820 [Siphonaria sp. JEL0065]|nr:hypothetical protein HDU68_011820 [Siphonaria sp. JEL0065]